MKLEHISDEQLVLALDNELSRSAIELVEEHLGVCAPCMQRYRQIGVLSVRLEQLLCADVSPPDLSARAQLCAALAKREEVRRLRIETRRWWALRGGIAALAAMLLVFVSIRPRVRDGARNTAISAVLPSGTFEAEGETFVALPYSNADLPTSAPQIVRMRLPASSLADAGVLLEPVTSVSTYPNRYVTADVVVGLDGEPMGVHVVD